MKEEIIRNAQWVVILEEDGTYTLIRQSDGYEIRLTKAEFQAIPRM